MEITIQGLGKKFQKEWVFRNLNCTFQNNIPTAIVGPNGSGKTTLLKLIAGFMQPSEGNVSYRNQSNEIGSDQIFKHMALAAPYLELVEELTLLEFLEFHFSFKSMVSGFSIQDFVQETSLTRAADKYIKHFSSGMKTRLKLGLCFFGASPIMLLDEPASNLDSKGLDWYQQNIMSAQKNRLLIICSNQKYEYQICEQIVDLAVLQQVET